jgi:hypothetical protein
MAAHVYHDGLPGYDPRQIWYDGCPECEWRGANMPHTVGTLDSSNLQRAMERARLWNGDAHDQTGPISKAEVPLLDFLLIAERVMKQLNYGIINL